MLFARSRRKGKKKGKKKCGGEFRGVFCSAARDGREFEPKRALPHGPIHADVKPENVLFRRGKLSGVIDFDNAYRGPLLLDLAKSMVWFGLDRNHFSVKNARDIYRGYVSSQKLTMLEYKELYRMLKFAFASHLYVDFYMKAIGKIPASYFNFLMNDFYGAYEHFSSTCDEKEFYSFLERR